MESNIFSGFMDNISYLKRKDGSRIAYDKRDGNGPGIIFLGGFRSDMTGIKATALEEFCKKRGQAFVRFDYRGHGKSSVDFADCTLGMWKDDALAVLNRLTEGPQILIGSSMGGWLSLLVAREKPKRVAGIIGIAAAPDFTELMWDRMTTGQQNEIRENGRVMVPSDIGSSYPVTREFLEESGEHLLMDAEIPVYCPVRLLHGMKDADVPWEIAVALNEKIASKDVKTILVEQGDHRLSSVKDIERLLRVTAKMLDALVVPA